MPSSTGFQFFKSYDRELWSIQGMILTDSSGDPTNTNAGTVLDQDGDPLLLPRGVASVVRSGTGLYTVTLNDEFNKILFATAFVYKAAAVKSTFDLVQFNPRGVTVGGVAVRTVQFRYKLDGAVTALVSAGFFLHIIARGDTP